MKKIKAIKTIWIIWRIKKLNIKAHKLELKIEKYTNELYQEYAGKMIDEI